MFKPHYLIWIPCNLTLHIVLWQTKQRSEQGRLAGHGELGGKLQSSKADITDHILAIIKVISYNIYIYIIHIYIYIILYHTMIIYGYLITWLLSWLSWIIIYDHIISYYIPMMFPLKILPWFLTPSSFTNILCEWPGHQGCLRPSRDCDQLNVWMAWNMLKLCKYMCIDVNMWLGGWLVQASKNAGIMRI